MLRRTVNEVSLILQKCGLKIPLENFQEAYQEKSPMKFE